MRAITVLLAVTTLFVAGCASTSKVYRVGDDKNGVGVHYSLPKTRVRVEVPITLKTYQPGRLARFAYPMLGIMAETGASMQYSIGDPVITPHAVSDTTETYIVKVKGGPLETRQLILELTELGFLTHGKSTVEDKTVDFAVAVVKTVASIAATAVKPAASLREAKLKETPELFDETAARKLLTVLDGGRRVRLLKDEARDLKKELETEPQSVRMKVANKALIKAMTDETCCGTGDVLLASSVAQKIAAGVLDLPNLASARAWKKNMQESTRVVYKLPKLPEKKEADKTKGSEKRADTTEGGEKKAATVSYLDEELKKVLSVPSIPDDSTRKTEPSLWSDVIKTLKEDTAGSDCYLSHQSLAALYDAVENLLAWQLAQRIIAFEENKRSYLTGSSTAAMPAGEGIAAFLAKMDEERQRLLEPFVGKTKESVWLARFELDPPETAEKPVDSLDPPETAKGPVDSTEELFEFSEGEGMHFCESTARLTLTNRKDAFMTARFLDSAERVSVSVHIKADPATQMAGEVASRNKTRDPRSVQGFRYRVPVWGEVIVEQRSLFEDDKGKTFGQDTALAYATVPFPQYGPTVALPHRSGSLKQSAVDVELNELTGGLKKVDVSGTALDPAIVDTLGQAVNAVQEAQKAAETASREAEAARKQAIAGLPMQALTQERDYLKLLSEIGSILNPIPEEE